MGPEQPRHPMEHPERLDLDTIDFSRAPDIERLVRAFRESPSMATDIADLAQGTATEICRLRTLAGAARNSGDEPEFERLGGRSEIFQELRSRYGADTYADVLSRFEAREVDPRLVRNWVQAGFLCSPTLMHAVVVGYPELEQAAKSKFDEICGPRLRALFLGNGQPDGGAD
jgi:hypothetical protein